MDAFTDDWSTSKLNWLCPPVNKIVATIKHCETCHAKGILLVPNWPSHAFYPILYNDEQFDTIVKDHFYIKCTFKKNSQSRVFNSHARQEMIALFLDFTLT